MSRRGRTFLIPVSLSVDRVKPVVELCCSQHSVMVVCFDVMNSTPERMVRAEAPRAAGLRPRREDLLPLAFTEPAPHAIGFVDAERVLAAFQECRAFRADGLGLGFPSRASRTAFPLWMEEERTGQPPAGRVQLPIPDIRVGSRKSSGVCHKDPLPLCRGYRVPGGEYRKLTSSNACLYGRHGPRRGRCRSCLWFDDRARRDDDQDPAGFPRGVGNNSSGRFREGS